MSEFPYTEPISDYIQGYQIGFEDGRADENKKVLAGVKSIYKGYCEQCNGHCSTCYVPKVISEVVKKGGAE